MNFLIIPNGLLFHLPPLCDVSGTPHGWAGVWSPEVIVLDLGLPDLGDLRLRHQD